MLNKKILDALYKKLNRRKWIHPDPLEFLYHYESPEDQEVVGLISAGLSYGRVAQILKSVQSVLEHFPSPARDIRQCKAKTLKKKFHLFRHRWTTGEELCDLILGIQFVQKKYGTLKNAFLTDWKKSDENILPALEQFILKLSSLHNGKPNSLLPQPGKKSACKRLHMYLRWMIRKDEVDPGCWSEIPSRALIIPLDTHIQKIARKLRICQKKQANLGMALEITEAFRHIAPRDPVRYDFCLSRLGIRSDTDMESFFIQSEKNSVKMGQRDKASKG